MKSNKKKTKNFLKGNKKFMVIIPGIVINKMGCFVFPYEI